jgi:pimeloyl-ACP methyl ester carboxylesterase
MEHLNHPLEQYGYLELGGDHIYSVLHGAANPLARVLLVGSFASERYFSWTPWVRWGRFLAERGIEALRFDYRGVGESTGAFETLSFSDWQEDVEFLARFLQRRSPNRPLILHGLEMGAVLASKAFAAGLGDALLLWSDPSDGTQVLRRPLSRHGFRNLFARKSAADYIREIEAGGVLEVDGYLWRRRLWRESFTFRTLPGQPTDRGRPVKSVTLKGTAASLLQGSAMGFVLSLNLDLTEIYTENAEWMMAAVSAPRERP